MDQRYNYNDIIYYQDSDPLAVVKTCAEVYQSYPVLEQYVYIMSWHLPDSPNVSHELKLAQGYNTTDTKCPKVLHITEMNDQFGKYISEGRI